MIKAHKIRLHPTPEQAQYFAKAAGTARFPFNWALAEWKDQDETGGKPGALTLKNQFHVIRKEPFPWTYDVWKSVIEGAFLDVASAFKNFFEGLPPVGLDVGLNRLATLSDGKQFENQKPLRTLLKQLGAANKKLARCVKGSVNWQKAKKKPGRLHDRIACIRDDILHKLTTEVSRTFGFVGVEDFHVKGLIQNRKLALSFSDAALGQLLRLLESKVTHAGGMLVKVGRFFPSSQVCHQCGWRWHDITLTDRIFICQNPTCGCCGDRDDNAAVNILNEALRLIGGALSDEVVPVVATTAPEIASGPGVRPTRR